MPIYRLNKLEVNFGEKLNLHVAVKNTGERTAAEVVQFYLKDLEASTTVPLSKLVGLKELSWNQGRVAL